MLNLFSIKLLLASSVEVASHSPDKNIFLELSLISRFKLNFFDFANEFLRSISKNKNASILIVNSNFGCGSSREHAPQALMRWGIKAIIGESFADIFYSNCIAIGIPCFTLPKKSIQQIQKFNKNKDLFLEIDLKNLSAKSTDYDFKLEIKESARRMFLTGEWDATSKLLENENLIENKFNELPYLKFNSHFY